MEKNLTKPVIMHIRLIRVIYQSEMSNGEGFFHQGYAAISCILVYLFNVFLLILDLRRVCERLCEFCVQCKKLSGSKVFFFSAPSDN